MQILSVAMLAAVTGASLLADVTYDQTVKYTGGALLEITRIMASNPAVGRRGGAAMKSAFQDQAFTVYVRGSKMARIGPAASTITDLDTGTITNINHATHTYSTQTFDEMRQRLERMQQHGQGVGDLQFDTKIDKTGKTQDIDGQTATETIITLTAKPGSANAHMAVKMDCWLIPPTASTREVIDYFKRLSEKFSLALGGSPGLGAAAAGISAAMKAALQLDGYPVLSDMQVSGVAAPMMGQSADDANRPFLETETRSSHFVPGPVDDSEFAIPAGYTQEEPRGGRPQ